MIVEFVLYKTNVKKKMHKQPRRETESTFYRPSAQGKKNDE